MRKTLSDKGVAALKPRAARYATPDPELRGHYVRVQPSGAKSYVAVTLNPDGKQIWTTIGAAEVFTIAETRERAPRRRSGQLVRSRSPSGIACDLTILFERFRDLAENRQPSVLGLLPSLVRDRFMIRASCPGAL